MSELQISLISIGIAVILAVYIYNWWQQRQYRRKFNAAFRHGHEDALYSPTSLEPSIKPPAEPPVTSLEPVLASAGLSINEPSGLLVEELADTALAREKETEQASGFLDEPQPGHAENSLCGSLNDETDYIVVVSLKNPVSASALAMLWQKRFDFGKSVQVCGLNAVSGKWEKVIADSQPVYISFKLALQLVHRSGVASEAKLRSFRELARMIATQLRADVVLPNAAEFAARALELDKFCATVDQMIVFNIVPDGERILSGDHLARVAERLGLHLQADGTFHMVNASGHTLFSLGNEDNTPFQHHALNQLHVGVLTLLLDVPRVDQPALAFDQMMALARKLAGELNGTIVDANHVPLSLQEGSILLIRERIVEVEADMHARHMPAGSILARRLFSS